MKFLSNIIFKILDFEVKKNNLRKDKINVYTFNWSTNKLKPSTTSKK